MHPSHYTNEYSYSNYYIAGIVYLERKRANIVIPDGRSFSIRLHFRNPIEMERKFDSFITCEIIHLFNLYSGHIIINLRCSYFYLKPTDSWITLLVLIAAPLCSTTINAECELLEMRKIVMGSCDKFSRKIRSYGDIDFYDHLRSLEGNQTTTNGTCEMRRQSIIIDLRLNDEYRKSYS